MSIKHNPCSWCYFVTKYTIVQKSTKKNKVHNKVLALHNIGYPCPSHIQCHLQIKKPSDYFQYTLLFCLTILHIRTYHTLLWQMDKNNYDLVQGNRSFLNVCALFLELKYYF